MTEPKERRPRANGLPAVPSIAEPGTVPRIVCLDRAKRSYVAFAVFETNGFAVAAFILVKRGGRDHWAALDIMGDVASAALRKGRIQRALAAFGR